MTEMTDLTSDLLGSGIPVLDYKVYAERVFFPGHQESPLHRDLGVPESRRPTVEQGLGQLSNLLNSKLFLLTVRATWAGWRGAWGEEGGWVVGRHRLHGGRPRGLPGSPE